MKTRHFLTVAEKIEILDLNEKNKEILVRNLSAIFSQKYEKNVTKSVVHRITQQKLERYKGYDSYNGWKCCEITGTLRTIRIESSIF